MNCDSEITGSERVENARFHVVLAVGSGQYPMLWLITVYVAAFFPPTSPYHFPLYLN